MALRKIDGWPIVDGTRDRTLRVTERDVSSSEGRKDPLGCMFARAGKRDFGSEVRVYRSRAYIRDSKNKRWERYIMPMSMTKELVAFDRGGSFQADEYTLGAPSSGQALGAHRERDEARKGGGAGAGQKRPTHVLQGVRERAVGSGYPSGYKPRRSKARKSSRSRKG